MTAVPGDPPKNLLPGEDCGQGVMYGPINDPKEYTLVIFSSWANWCNVNSRSEIAHLTTYNPAGVRLSPRLTPAVPFSGKFF